MHCDGESASLLRPSNGKKNKQKKKTASSPEKYEDSNFLPAPKQFEISFVAK